MEPREQADDWKAPYISYTTLNNFLEEKLGSNPLPPRIDRGFLDSYSGSVQPMLLGALKTIGLIDEDGAVLDALREVVRSPEARRDALRLWAESFYQEQLSLAKENATAQMLHESFAKHDYTGSTLRKAIVFFLTLVDDLGLPRSPHFRPPRQASGAVKPRRKRQARVPEQVPKPEEPTSTGEEGERKTVLLGGAGTVTIVVNVRWLDLPDDAFMKLRDAIRAIEALAVPHQDSPGVGEDPEVSE